MRRFAAALLLLIAPQLHAASEYPPQYRWRTITTEHFYVHFHQGEEDLAQRAAVYAEGAHRRLVPLMGWTPRERTHVVLTDHVDASNGSATPFPNNRIEIYVSAPGADPSSAIEYYDNWLNLVITHEYTHILHLDQARGFGRKMRMIFGRNPLLLSFPNIWSPLWMIEGIATLTETEETDAGRLKGTFVDMVLRTAAVENQFASQAVASGLGPYWPTGNTRYFYGSKFLSWLATKRGMPKLTEYMNEYSGNIVPFRVNATAEDVYGTTMEGLWDEWTAEQQQIYRADRDRLAADGLTDRKRLTTLGYETTHPILSPDGSRIAYGHSGPFERATIRIRDLASGRDVATHRVNATSPLSWSADGHSIAYSDLEFVGSFALLSDLYVWDVDRGGARRVTRGARLKDPAFTPDGRTLVAVENRLGRNRLVEVDVANGEIRALVEPNDFRQFGEPAVSHDGRRIALAEWQNGTIDIVIYSRSGERLANITEGFTHATNASPRFSPDDRTIWFSSDVTGVPNIYSVPSSGGQVRRLSNVYGGAFYPTSVDGRRFFYSDYSSDGFDLATFNVEKDYPVATRVIPTTVVGNQAATPNAVPTTSEAGRQQATDYSPWRSLRPRWWFPIIGTSSANGEDRVDIGFTTSGGDVLGRHTYQATITNRGHDVLYSYDRFYPTISLGAARYDDVQLRFITPSADVKYTTTIDRLLAEVSFPWRKAQWQLAGSVGAVRDRIGGHLPPGLSETDLDSAGIFRGTLQGIRLGTFFNNSHEYLFSISQEHGVTALLNYENLSRGLGSDRSLQQLTGDVRTYLTIPYSRSPLGRHVVAFRVAGGRNSGDVVLQRDLQVGGDGAGEVATLDTTHFPVRGYDTSTLRGQSAAIASIEYRFPIYEIDRGPSTWPIFFNRIHGDVFVDAGRAWQQRTLARGTDTIVSTGAEVSADFILINALAIRYRIGVAYLLRDPGKGKTQTYASIGSSF